ncbi:MAG: phage major capsid protein [Thermoleophilia bacterium]
MATAIGITDPLHGASLERETVIAELVAPLMASTVTLESGIGVYLADPGVPIRIPRVGDLAPDGSYWASENASVTEATTEIDHVVLLPSELKSVKVIVRVSNEFLKRSAVPEVMTNVFEPTESSLVRPMIVRGESADPNVTPSPSRSTIGGLLVEQLAVTLDHAMLANNGASNTVTGLMHITGRQTLTVGGPLTLDAAHDAVGLLLAANCRPSTWFMNPWTLVQLRKLKDNVGRPIVHPDAQIAGAYMLLGCPILTTTNIPQTDALLIDRSKIKVAIDTGAEVKVLDQRYADQDQTGLRVVMRADIAAIREAGVVHLTSITPGDDTSGSGSGSGSGD